MFNQSTQLAVIATLSHDHVPTTMGGATHIHITFTYMHQSHYFNDSTHPTITNLTILTPIPPRGVRVGAGTCILAMFPKLPHVDYKLFNYSKQIVEILLLIIRYLRSTYEVFLSVSMSLYLSPNIS